jgi:hypothetical protein
LLGRVVSVLVNDNQKAGEYRIKYNASALTSGIYFCKIATSDYTDIKRMMLIK